VTTAGRPQRRIIVTVGAALALVLLAALAAFVSRRGDSDVPVAAVGSPPDSAPMTPAKPTTTTADDPIVRPPTTVPSGNAAAPTTTAPAAGNCPASGVRVTVATDKPAYAAGETVRGSTTIENRSGTTCLLPTRGFVRILNAAGEDVSSFAYTMEYRFPIATEPGKTFTTPFTWDQKDCSGPACVQVPAGAYTVMADWTEGGPYSGRGSFTIGG
jgi:hypothetical protein